jgi:chromosome segregation ATPase
MTTPQDRLTIEGLRQTVAEQDATIATLRAEYAAQLNLTIEAKGEIATLRADAAATIDRWAEALGEIATLRADLALADTTAANLHDEIRKRDEAIATLRAALELAHDHHSFGPRDCTSANCSAEAVLATFRPHPDRRTEW